MITYLDGFNDRMLNSLGSAPGFRVSQHITIAEDSRGRALELVGAYTHNIEKILDVPTKVLACGFFMRTSRPSVPWYLRLCFGTNLAVGQWFESFYPTWYPNFNITVTFLSNYSCKFSFLTGRGSCGGANSGNTYEAIPDSPVVYTDVRGWNFYEFYVDLTNAATKQGVVKVALNGTTVYSNDELYTGDYLLWAGNPAYANHNGILIQTPLTPSPPSYHIDDLYICDSRLSYHNDLLGPGRVSTLLPGSPGDLQNWPAFQNSEPVEGLNPQMVSTCPVDITASETAYVQGTQEGIADLYYFNNTIPYNESPLDIIGVGLRLMARRVAVAGTPPADDLMPLSRPPGRPIEEHDEAFTKVSSYDYKTIDVYFSIVPQLAIPWTWGHLNETQFGFRLYESVFTSKLEEPIQVDDDPWDGYELIDDGISLEEGIGDPV